MRDDSTKVIISVWMSCEVLNDRFDDDGASVIMPLCLSNDDDLPLLEKYLD